jgi:Sap, sulfolipid-1-addressing protein
VDTRLHIVPLALIMVMGPQILTSIFLVTSREPVKNSLAMLIGAALGVCTSILVWYGLVKALHISPREGGGPSTADYVVAGLLALLAIHVFRGRGKAKVPKWMTALEEAEPKRAFSLGYLLILLMPTDIIAVIATANYLRDHHMNQVHGWSLVAATVALLAIPLAAYLLLGRRAREAMPGIREWLTGNAWLVNLIVIVYFIYQTLH